LATFSELINELNHKNAGFLRVEVLKSELNELKIVRTANVFLAFTRDGGKEFEIRIPLTITYQEYQSIIEIYTKRHLPSCRIKINGLYYERFYSAIASVIALALTKGITVDIKAEVKNPVFARIQSAFAEKMLKISYEEFDELIEFSSKTNAFFVKEKSEKTTRSFLAGKR
jgi:hypothetical protein